MGKHGPCCHCGVTSTPLWRNGPPEKPVLCNACGSRWRTKGSLTNYTPMHSRELLNQEETEFSKPKKNSFGRKEQKMQEKKANGYLVRHEIPFCDQNFRMVLEEDTNNRSSSGSAVSYSESCAHFGLLDASDFAVSSQSNISEPLVSSRKRTCVPRSKPSPVEKLRNELYSIWNEQHSSCLSECSQEDLLLESETQFGSFEMGHGSVLISNHGSKGTEESEASSSPMDNKLCVLSSRNKGTGSSDGETSRLRKPSTLLFEVHPKRVKAFCGSSDILQDKASPLCSIDLKDILSSETFRTQLTHDEQHKLMKYLPSSDTTNLPESITSMFQCPQFVETLSCYQRLLTDGVFDLSFRRMSTAKCTKLKRLVLFDFTKARWAEYYEELKGIEVKIGGSSISTAPSCVGHSNSASRKRLNDLQNKNLREIKGLPKSLGRTCTLPRSSNMGSETVSGADDYVDDDGACFSAHSLFAFPPDRSHMMASLQCTGFNGSTAISDLPLEEEPHTSPPPSAELLYRPPGKPSPTASNISPAESGVTAGEESFSISRSPV